MAGWKAQGITLRLWERRVSWPSVLKDSFSSGFNSLVCAPCHIYYWIPDFFFLFHVACSNDLWEIADLDVVFGTRQARRALGECWGVNAGWAAPYPGCADVHQCTKNASWGWCKKTRFSSYVQPQQGYFQNHRCFPPSLVMIVVRNDKRLGPKMMIWGEIWSKTDIGFL